LNLVYDRGGIFAAGAGVGLQTWSRRATLPIAAFARARVLRRGPVSLGMSVALSRHDYSVERRYQRPPVNRYAAEYIDFDWQPGYRLTGALATEYAKYHWSLRLELGLGYFLDQPTCGYRSELVQVHGACDSPAIPEAYRFESPPGRFLPSATLAVGYRFGGEDERTGPRPPGYRSPVTALLLSLGSTFGATAGGIGLLVLSDRYDRHEEMTLTCGAVLLGLGLTIAPSAGHFYAGERRHAWLTSILRASAGGLAVALFMVALGDGCHEGDCLSGPEAGISLLFGISVPILALYDVIDSPYAARRSNTRNGITVSLVPTRDHDGRPSSPGLALTGRF
jgi:hypothetical protein